MKVTCTKLGSSPKIFEYIKDDRRYLQILNAHWEKKKKLKLFVTTRQAKVFNMDPSPANMSFRRKNHLGDTRIGAPKQLQVPDDEEKNGEVQLVDNVRDDDIGEHDDHVYEISRNMESAGKQLSLKFEGEEQ